MLLEACNKLNRLSDNFEKVKEKLSRYHFFYIFHLTIQKWSKTFIIILKEKEEEEAKKKTIRFSRHERIDATLLSRLPRILRQEPGLETALIFVVNSYQVEWRRQYTRTHRTMPHICDPWWSHPSWNLLRHVFPRGWMPFREDVWGMRVFEANFKFLVP